MWWEKKLKKYQFAGPAQTEGAAAESTGVTMPQELNLGDFNYEPEVHKPKVYPQNQTFLSQDNRTDYERELARKNTEKILWKKEVAENTAINPNLGFVRGQIGGGRNPGSESAKNASNIFMNTIAGSTPAAMMGKTAINAIEGISTGDPIASYYRDTEGMPQGMRRPMAYQEAIMNLLGTGAYAKSSMPQVSQTLKPITTPAVAATAPFISRLNLPKTSFKLPTLTSRQLAVKSRLSNMASRTKSRIDKAHNITDKVLKSQNSNQEQVPILSQRDIFPQSNLTGG